MSREIYSSHAVRLAAWRFLTGKVASAILTLVIVVWLVRLLPLADYGAYVVLIAGAELGFAVASMGLPWLAARYLPDYRLHSSGHDLANICLRLILWQALALFFLAFVVALVLDHYLHWAGLDDYYAAAWLVLAVLIFEGLGRFLREGMMAPLLLQGEARFSLILRQLLFIISITGLAITEHIQLIWVLASEACASALAWLIALLALAGRLRALRQQTGEPGWKPPKFTEQWRIALYMHSASIISIAYSPQVFINLVQRSLGTEASALFGFLRALYDIVARYLPATLLFSVLRPKLIASYIQGGMAAMMRQVNLAGKLSLFALLPIIVLAALGGDMIVAISSGGKFLNGGTYLLVLLIALLPLSQRQLIETVAVAAGRAGLCTMGSIVGLLALPLMLTLLELGLGIWAPVLGILIGQILVNVTVLVGLIPSGYRVDWRGGLKLATSAFVAWLAAVGVMLYGHGTAKVLLAWVLATIVFLAVSWRLQAFTADDRYLLGVGLGLKLNSR